MRAVFLCPVVCHLAALQTGALRSPWTNRGRAFVPPGRSVCTVRFFTDGHGRAAPASCSGLTCAAESGVHPPVSVPQSGGFPRAGRGREGGGAGDWGGGPGERDACWAGGAGTGCPRLRVRAVRCSALARVSGLS